MSLVRQIDEHIVAAQDNGIAIGEIRLSGPAYAQMRIALENGYRLSLAPGREVMAVWDTTRAWGYALYTPDGKWIAKTPKGTRVW